MAADARRRADTAKKSFVEHASEDLESHATKAAEAAFIEAALAAKRAQEKSDAARRERKYICVCTEGTQTECSICAVDTPTLATPTPPVDVPDELMILPDGSAIKLENGSRA